MYKISEMLPNNCSTNRSGIPSIEDLQFHGKPIHNIEILNREENARRESLAEDTEHILKVKNPSSFHAN